MQKPAVSLNQSELKSLCLIAINSEPVAQHTKDVWRAIRAAGWETEITSIERALVSLAEHGMIALVRHIDEPDLWYSLEWEHGGGNL